MRWILRIALTLLTLVVVVIAALFLIPTDRIARIAETQFEEATGRVLTITGDVSPTLYPRLGVALEGASIQNAAWSEDGPMLQADRLEVAVGLSALMGGAIDVEAFTVDGPVIRLQRQPDGSANWDFLTQMGSSEDTSDSGTPNISVPKATITNGTLIFDDAGTAYQLDNVNLTLTLPDLEGIGEIDLAAELRGQAIELGGTIDGVQQLLDGSERSVDLELTAGRTSASFDGIAGIDPVRVKGQVTGDIQDQNALFALLGQEAPIIPPGLGQTVKMSAELTMTPDNQLFLRGADVLLDQNRLQGDVDLALTTPPTVKARLTGDSLDFSAMSTDTTEGDGAANAGAGGWSDARLDVSGLNAVNGDFSFKANAVDLGSIKLGPTDMQGSLDNSRLVLDLSGVSVFSGLVSGQFVVNGRGGLSVGGDLSASNVAMQQVLNDFAGYDRLVGNASMRLKFLGVGGTMDQIMKGLSGSGSLDVGAGELLGLDIAGMIKNLDTSYQGSGSRTIFDDITASFTIADGVLRNRDLSFIAPLLTASGAGQLDLGAQTIDYRVEPVALGGALEGGIRVPVLITGPWGNIKFRPDLEGLIDMELEEEKERLKAKAKEKERELKAKAEAKLQEELGVRSQDGDSLEDTLKKGLEEKAKEGLFKLFD